MHRESRPDRTDKRAPASARQLPSGRALARSVRKVLVYTGATHEGDVVRQYAMLAGLFSAGAIALAGCTAFPPAPSTVGSNWPSTGVPTTVRWPTDWIDSLSGESEAVGGPIVGLRLEYAAQHWVWRIRSTDPGRADLLGESNAEPTSGVEAFIDATDLSLERGHQVTLTKAEATEADTSYYDAVQASGEELPSP